MQLSDWYPETQVPRADNVVPMQSSNVQAAGKITQSVEGSVSVNGQPAAWFLALVAAAFVVYHLS